MKASYQMEALPKEGVQVTEEGALVRLLFDFIKAEPTDGDGAAGDIYECESVDVQGRSYGDIVAAIVNDRYSQDSVQAIMANHEEANDADSDITDEKRAEYIAEYNTYQQFRKHAKDIAKIVVETLNK